MDDWFSKYKKSEEQVSSIAPGHSAGASGASNASSTGSAQPQSYQPHTSPPQEAITQLGSSYEIKNVTKAKSEKSSFPVALLVLAVVLPLVFIMIMGTISNRQEKKDTKSDSFLSSTLESNFFTLSVDPNYSIDSVVDKKVPFLERHILTNTKDGQKTLTIVIKDVPFDYDIEDNLGAKARRENPKLYSEQSYELKGKQGMYYKKREENFEHFVLLLDRSRSVLYEITMNSPTTFATDTALEVEFKDILDKITFINQ